MGPFVILAMALTLAATGVTVVAAVHLYRRTRRLTEAVARAGSKLSPLLDELQAEAEVTSAEAEQIQRRSRDRRGG